MDDLLAEIGLLIERQNNRIGNYIIPKIRPAGKRKDQEADLDRRRPGDQDLGAGISKVNQNVDFVGANDQRGFLTRKRVQIDETIDGFLQTPPQLTAVIGPQRRGDDVESLTIEMFKHHGRCFAKAGGNVPQPDFADCAGSVVLNADAASGTTCLVFAVIQ